MSSWPRARLEPGSTARRRPRRRRCSCCSAASARQPRRRPRRPGARPRRGRPPRRRRARPRPPRRPGRPPPRRRRARPRPRRRAGRPPRRRRPRRAWSPGVPTSSTQPCASALVDGRPAASGSRAERSASSSAGRAGGGGVEAARGGHVALRRRRTGRRGRTRSPGASARAAEVVTVYPPTPTTRAATVRPAVAAARRTGASRRARGMGSVWRGMGSLSSGRGPSSHGVGSWPHPGPDPARGARGVVLDGDLGHARRGCPPHRRRPGRGGQEDLPGGPVRTCFPAMTMTSPDNDLANRCCLQPSSSQPPGWSPTAPDHPVSRTRVTEGHVPGRRPPAGRPAARRASRRSSVHDPVGEQRAGPVEELLGRHPVHGGRGPGDGAEVVPPEQPPLGDRAGVDGDELVARAGRRGRTGSPASRAGRTSRSRAPSSSSNSRTTASAALSPNSMPPPTSRWNDRPGAVVPRCTSRAPSSRRTAATASGRTRARGLTGGRRGRRASGRPKATSRWVVGRAGLYGSGAEAGV